MLNIEGKLTVVTGHVERDVEAHITATGKVVKLYVLYIQQT